MALYVITGPPAAGKTTYVATHARPGAVVLDCDRLAVALTAPR
jgi:dephospho-CoA kinase